MSRILWQVKKGSVALYAKTRPDIVITPIVFPPIAGKARIGGIELMDLLKNIDENVKVIVSYDINTKYLLMSALRAGAVARIKRPYKYQTVLQAIGGVISPESAGATLVRLKKPLHVKYRPSRKWIGRSLRPAFTQILLNTEEELPDGTNVDLEITLPKLKDPIRGQGKVMQVKTIVPEHSYEIDCSLSGLSDEAKRKLDVFLVWGEAVGAGAE
jgi:CheY-like chemotaxis protein